MTLDKLSDLNQKITKLHLERSKLNKDLKDGIHMTYFQSFFSFIVFMLISLTFLTALIYFHLSGSSSDLLYFFLGFSSYFVFLIITDLNSHERFKSCFKSPLSFFMKIIEDFFYIVISSAIFSIGTSFAFNIGVIFSGIVVDFSLLFGVIVGAYILLFFKSLYIVYKIPKVKNKEEQQKMIDKKLNNNKYIAELDSTISSFESEIESFFKTIDDILLAKQLLKSKKMPNIRFILNKREKEIVKKSDFSSLKEYENHIIKSHINKQNYTIQNE